MLFLLVSFIPFALFSSVAAQGQTVQDSWIAPSLPDLSTTIYEGVPYTLTWDNTLQNWFAQYSPEAQVTNVTLWIAAVQLSYAHIIEEFVDVTRTRQITWTPNLPANEFAEDQNWSFRFLPSNYTSLGTPGASGEEIDSPQILYKPATTTTTSSSSSTQAPTSTTATSPATRSASTTPTPTAAPSSGLSHGAIAGIALGAAGATVLVAAMAYLGLRLRRTSKALSAERCQNSFFPVSSPSAGGAAMSYSGASGPDSMGPGYYPSLNGSGRAPGTPLAEAPAQTAELGGVEYRGELEGHEIKDWRQ